ncbi:hypothetical protein PhaeoP75_01459 [Phaeobacter gallaeciensis]|uniref:Uncharacterized protein n=1 Tax=Phaeobacter gallaeciensis TaxID=60890 RepID=A0AAC9Z8N3_9RHOB|nr:hypothetical protein Gal_01418 [Phaeobacter gallaeciensis DSM 26640]ATE92443.1 hypothetical protein PhaeoP11_01409 [Phaeobacter gallaeciensis]ATE97735.1 hypothetical protein PhaeoP73_02437 [Phaeobacter gallaeciensis]ATF01108.1 hypothetical protein PhaeoP75_01459 [Phaeobacter gallaeciensis]ATF05488.1 hypothetical protein PhaeoP63_01407 [Phaeobacter gallaeciensis]
MVDIFSKRDGPRLEDVRAKRLLSENAGTIRKLADQISNGGFSRMQADQARRKQQPKPEGLIIHDMKARVNSDVPEPYVKVSLNNRVVLVDKSTGMQMCMLGEIRGNFLSKKFVLATKENGFLSPLEGELAAALAHLEGAEITETFDDRALAEAIESLIISKDD